MKLCSIDH